MDTQTFTAMSTLMPQADLRGQQVKRLTTNVAVTPLRLASAQAACRSHLPGHACAARATPSERSTLELPRARLQCRDAGRTGRARCERRRPLRTSRTCAPRPRPRPRPLPQPARGAGGRVSGWGAWAAAGRGAGATSARARLTPSVSPYSKCCGSPLPHPASSIAPTAPRRATSASNHSASAPPPGDSAGAPGALRADAPPGAPPAWASSAAQTYAVPRGRGG